MGYWFGPRGQRHASARASTQLGWPSTVEAIACARLKFVCGRGDGGALTEHAERKILGENLESLHGIGTAPSMHPPPGMPRSAGSSAESARTGGG